MNAPACTAGRGIHLFSHRKCVCIFAIPLFHFPHAKLQFFPPAAQILHLQIFNLQKYISSLIINIVVPRPPRRARQDFRKEKHSNDRKGQQQHSQGIYRPAQPDAPRGIHHRRGVLPRRREARPAQQRRHRRARRRVEGRQRAGLPHSGRPAHPRARPAVLPRYRPV